MCTSPEWTKVASGASVLLASARTRRSTPGQPRLLWRSLYRWMRIHDWTLRNILGCNCGASYRVPGSCGTSLRRPPRGCRRPPQPLDQQLIHRRQRLLPRRAMTSRHHRRPWTNTGKDKSRLGLHQSRPLRRRRWQLISERPLPVVPGRRTRPPQEQISLMG